MSKINIESIWKSNTELIRLFLEKRNDYEQLCSEIAYILKKRLSKSNLEYSTINNRAKTLNSFLEKIHRKSYNEPFKDITDFAGVRIVYLYQSDLDMIEEIIKDEFTILERIDKLNDKGIDKFGYGAIHYIVKIGTNTVGARYDDLKNLVCEIQVKTVLQDAWSIIDHHLAYKNESDIPSKLQRKLNSLAGLFETADNQFDIIREERENYLKKINESLKTENFLYNELNLDTFVPYLLWKFPMYEIKTFENQPKITFNNISRLKFKTLKELDDIIEKYIKIAPKIKKELEKEFNYEYFEDTSMPSSLLVSTILQIDNKKYLENSDIPGDVKEYLLKKYHTN